jgi:hypothetical protein
MMEQQKQTVGLAKPGGDMRSEHRVSKKPAGRLPIQIAALHRGRQVSRAGHQR